MKVVKLTGTRISPTTDVTRRSYVNDEDPNNKDWNWNPISWTKVTNLTGNSSFRNIENS